MGEQVLKKRARKQKLPNIQATTMPVPEVGERPAVYADRMGDWYVAQKSNSHRKSHGLYLTPIIAADFMANQIKVIGEHLRVLDPAAGAGILSCVAVEALVSRPHKPKIIEMVAYEVDHELVPILRAVFDNLTYWCSTGYGVILKVRIEKADFVLAHAEALRLFGGLIPYHSDDRDFDVVISNPPYFKISKADPRAAAAASVVRGQPNIYGLFMAVSAALLKPEGDFIFIVPRSFASGPYFQQFRSVFFNIIRPTEVHVFGSRSDAFSRDEVLQENVIFSGLRDDHWHGRKNQSPLTVSSSQGVADIGEPYRFSLPVSVALDLTTYDKVLRLPLTDDDCRVLALVDAWPSNLNGLGLNISTGPVVPFRATELITKDGSLTQGHVPLLWMNHVKPMRVTWPLGRHKQEYMKREGAEALLVANKNYVLLRRFSAKEEARRLIAAPLVAADFVITEVGLENHLNYVHRPSGSLSEDESWGLAALYNSRLLDTYFRTANGNTQVSATELRAMPLPPREIIITLGRSVKKLPDPLDGLDELVLRLVANLNIKEVPLSSVEEAQDILKALGMPPAQYNQMSGMTLLALCGLTPTKPWSEAKRDRRTVTKGVMDYLRQYYGTEYAPNTRETFRRQVLHQFVQGHIADYNPFDRDLPTNSPRAHYAIAEAALAAVQLYGTLNWELAVDKFKREQGALTERYDRDRSHNRVPIKLPDGQELQLSPGSHNEVQKAIVEEFAPRFSPGAQLLYLGDTAKKNLFLDKDGLARLGIPLTDHDKLPDVVLYDAKRKWLFLVEAVTSHGPMSPKRIVELEKLLVACDAGPVYVSAFPDFAEFRKHMKAIAWETEVWLCDTPDHMIHYNGDRFLGPRKGNL